MSAETALRDEREAATRRARRMALMLGLPWGWQVRRVGRMSPDGGRLVATGPKPLPCGHRSVSASIGDGDVPMAVARLAHAVRFHEKESHA